VKGTDFARLVIARGRPMSFVFIPHSSGTHSSLLAHDEIHDRLRVFRRKRKMPFARSEAKTQVPSYTLVHRDPLLS
jgi:hypothetical protein